MIYQEFDHILVGKHYLSALLGLRLLKSGKKVIIIDDGTKVSHRWSRHWSYLEKKIITDIGEELKITELIHIEKYLSPMSLILCLNDTFVEIDNSPFSNLRELARKMPASFSSDFISMLDKISPEDFDLEIKKWLDHIAQFGRKHGFENLKNFNDKEWDAYKEINNIIDYFFNSIGKFSSELTEQIYFVLKVLYQSSFDNNFAFGETVYLFAKLISPAFYLDAEKLNQDLINKFLNYGGIVEESKIAKFDFDKNDFHSLILDNYLGRIKGHETYIMGHLHKEHPFLLSQYRAFLSISFELEIKHQYLEMLKNKLIIFSEHLRMGTDFPFLDIYFDGEKFQGLFVYGEVLGARDIFYFEQVKKDVYMYLKKILPGVKKEDIVQNINIHKGDDIWVDLSAPHLLIFNKSSNGLHLFDKINLDLVKNVTYHGPLKNQNFGLHTYISNLVK
jgi:hypothetical protein